MGIHSLRLIPPFRNHLHKGRMTHSPSIMAGIYQNVFFKQWGSPEIEMNISCPNPHHACDSVKVPIDNPADEFDVVLVYKARNRIFFFKKKRLLYHFKWNGYGEKCLSLPPPAAGDKSPWASFKLAIRHLIGRVSYE